MSSKIKPQSQSQLVPTTEVFRSRVMVEHFPSRVELYELLNKFITSNNYTKDYTCDNKDNCVNFTFKNPDISFEFIKMLNLEKLKNPLYIKLKTSLLIDANKEAKKNTKPKAKLVISTTNSPDKNLSSSHKAKKDNIVAKSLGTLDLKYLNRSNSSSRIMYSDENDYTPTMPRGKTLRASVPYKDKKVDYDEVRRQKEKWLETKGFNFNFGKSNTIVKNEISNYVFQTQAKIPLPKYKFREVRKDKWLDKAGIQVRNSSDLVL